jgi:hypothetical protein
LKGPWRKERNAGLGKIGTGEEYELRLVDDVWLVETGSGNAEAI